MTQPQRQQGQGSPTGQPSLRPTNPATLIVVGLATAALAWILVANNYGSFPDIPWLPAFTIFALAILEALLARATKARIDRRPGAERVEPLMIARYVVLAKASSMVGAIFGGFYAGLLVWLLAWGNQLTHADRDVAPTAGGLVASLALIAAALWLEHSCRVPKRPEDDEPPE
jgi:hypothetical protein